ncbi:MAG: DUF2092 domain-containing protein [Kiritimatiellia bacterium]
MYNRLFFALFPAAFLAASSFAGDTNTVDPKAETILRALSAYFKTVPTFKVDLEAETRIESPDMKQEFTTRATLAVKKPDKIAMAVKNSMIGTLLLTCNGATFVTFLPALNRYTIKPAPDSLEKLSIEMNASSPACLPVISALLERDPFGALVNDASRILYLGEEAFNGVPCHRLKFEHSDFDCEAWIRTGPLPLLEAIKPCLAKSAALNKMPADMKANVLLQLKNWECGGELPDSLFTLELPAEAQKVDSLFPGAAAETAENEEPDPSDALKQKPAPGFTLPLLGGGTFKLASQTNKAVTVICFWTTWAGPCRHALPMLEKTAASYKDKNVRFLFINQQEPEAAIHDFLKSAELTLPVGLDKESEVAGLYQVAGVPQTVIIDKAGIVREIYVGYGRSLEDDIRLQINELLLPPAVP